MKKPSRSTPPEIPAPAPTGDPVEHEVFETLVAEKMGAGLPRRDAEEVARRQLEHDARLAR